ncbi:MAG: EscU/YscU/HrcU family type III secretion system export apparatus switch protein [Bryobacterales bacterium]|nr:EscU/YscU/HrcU family type III secretion system export apparatus switch protein [Bryobacterales bacterium]
MADRSQQTEKATPRRVEKARREGRFPVSRDFVSALQFLVFIALLAGFGQEWFHSLRITCRFLLAEAFRTELSPVEVRRLLQLLLARLVMPLLIAGGVLMGVTVLTQLGTTRGGLAAKSLAPDFTRLNPLRKLKELPRQNLTQFFQALLLLPLFCGAVYAVARDNLDAFLQLPFAGVESGIRFTFSALESVLWKAAALFLVWGAVDLFRQRRRYERDLRMTRQEIREEAKETDGNPQTKGRIRRLQRDLLRRRMMQEVPKATAVVVNPTHYAVALRYQMERMSAPVVVAKGRNYLALRIRQRAIESQVPIIENPPLAQALYKSAEVGQEIPPALYRAVAEILAYIFRLTNRRLG